MGIDWSQQPRSRAYHPMTSAYITAGTFPGGQSRFLLCEVTCHGLAVLIHLFSSGQPLQSGGSGYFEETPGLKVFVLLSKMTAHIGPQSVKAYAH